MDSGSPDNLAAIEELKRRIAARNLRVLVGAGVAMAASSKAKSWLATLQDALSYMERKGLVEAGWVRQEKSDLALATEEDFLNKAEQISSRLRKSQDNWSEWLCESFGNRGIC